jgi:hypothetical protein
MIFVFPFVALAVLTFVAAWAWWFMAARPQRWAQWVDRENDFWRERGWISAGASEKLKRWEKGTALRLTAAITAFIGALGVLLTLLVLIKAERIQHQRLRLPVNPALRIKPKQPKLGNH